MMSSIMKNYQSLIGMFLGQSAYPQFSQYNNSHSSSISEHQSLISEDSSFGEMNDNKDRDFEKRIKISYEILDGCDKQECIRLKSE